MRGYRSSLAVPMIRERRPIGAISVTRSRKVVRRSPDQLLKTFADQAVIAIENVRLFDEVQATTRDLTEALTYQTGSSNILSVIASSPTDVRPVLRAIVESACELCGAYDAFVLLKDGDNCAPARITDLYRSPGEMAHQPKLGCGARVSRPEASACARFSL